MLHVLYELNIDRRKKLLIIGIVSLINETDLSAQRDSFTWAELLTLWKRAFPWMGSGGPLYTEKDMFYCFCLKESLVLQQQHLFNEKYSKTGSAVKSYQLKLIFSFLKCNLFQEWQSYIFSIISVTRSFRKYSNMLIWCSRNICMCKLSSLYKLLLCL